jgi:hypothetical protein
MSKRLYSDCEPELPPALARVASCEGGACILPTREANND